MPTTGKKLYYQFLARLRHASLPLRLDAHGDIDCVYALSAGKLVEATLPEVEFRREGARYGGPAMVMKLTPLGLQLAEEFAQRGSAWRRV